VPAEVLYRKWRPQRFADVSGQEVVKRTLLNALRGGKVSHAYLFSGPRGTGKTTMGRLLTKAINCERNASEAVDRPGEPCNECGSCVAYNEGRALDLIELDGASNRGIDDIRDLRTNAGYAPMAGGSAHKVYLIDEVHMLTEQAFNALLKTLEEPPPHIVFILATTDAHKVPSTITSRCQRMDFKRIPAAAVSDRLEFIASQEAITMSREGLDAIAQAATGSLRDAINLLEQICDTYGKDVSTESVREGLGQISDERTSLMIEQALRGDLGMALATLNSVRDDGIDLRLFQREVISYLRDVLLAQAGAITEDTRAAEHISALRKVGESAPQPVIVRLLKLLSEADLRQDPLSPLPLEIALAESMQAPAAIARAEPAPTSRQEPAAARPSMPAGRQQPPPSPPPARPPQQTPRTAPPRDLPPREFRRDNITGASPADIAKMVGSSAPVLSEEEAAPAAAPPNAVKTAAGEIDLSTWVHEVLRPRMKDSDPRLGQKLSAMINGNCHAVSLQDGILTIAFYQEAFSKKQVEGEHRAAFERVASELLGEKVAVRCIIAQKPAKALKSPLVQHAVERHGARIVSQE
jgi:DNA polymerase-3 subunit gamma/tau